MGTLLLGASRGQVESFFRLLPDSSTLRSSQSKETLVNTGLVDGRNWSIVYRSILVSLIRSSSNVELDEDVLKQFMEVLQVNLTVKRIRQNDPLSQTDGNKPSMEEALRQNVEQESYVPFHPTQENPLFLYDSPFTGETELLHTMTRSFSERRWLRDKATRLWRTKDTEVEPFRANLEMQIVVWDLAGQWNFWTLQDTLFLRTNHNFIFLFVFSPYERKKCSFLDQCFKTELEE